MHKHNLTTNSKTLRRALIISLAPLLSIIALTATPAAQAQFGISSFASGTCQDNPAATPGDIINYPAFPAATPVASGCNTNYTQAGGHPNSGVTDFVMNTERK